MDLDNFVSPAAGKMTPYSAVVIFSLGIFISNFLFNTILLKRPISGEPSSYKEYFRGSFPTHLVGILGGIIWGIGNSFNLIAAGKAGAAISYGLG
jgi:glucose uptake protein